MQCQLLAAIEGGGLFLAIIVCFAVVLVLGVLLLPRARGWWATAGDGDGRLEAYRASSLHEAHLVAGLMQQAGLSVTIANEYASNLTGELSPYAAAPTIWVQGESDFARAREIVAQYEERLNDEHAGSLPEWTCDSCHDVNPGNFEACWKCGKTRP